MTEPMWLAWFAVCLAVALWLLGKLEGGDR